MTRIRPKAARDKLLRRVRKQRLKSITVLPSLVTILNGICGFAAIVFAARGVYITRTTAQAAGMSYFAMSGYMIILAMIADVLDGRLARMSKSTSSFGGQLDSLCDVISFGLAPAFLMLKLIEKKFMQLEVNMVAQELLQRALWLAAAAYFSCAAIRLARFNVENEEDESAHMSFVGLPTPAAAGVVVSLVIFHQEMLGKIAAYGSLFYRIMENTIVYALPVLVIGIAFLMVSRIRYPHIINQYFKGKKRFDQLIRILLLLGLAFWQHQIAMIVIFFGFAGSGFFKWLYYQVIRKKYIPMLEKQSQGYSAAEEPQA